MGVDLEGVMGGGLLQAFRVTFAEGGRYVWLEPDPLLMQPVGGAPTQAEPQVAPEPQVPNLLDPSKPPSLSPTGPIVPGAPGNAAPPPDGKAQPPGPAPKPATPKKPKGNAQPKPTGGASP